MPKRSLKLVDLHVVPVKLYRGKHAKSCECPTCLKAKLGAFRERMREMESARGPTTVDATVPVRAHWRRQANHLAKSPQLRELVRSIVAEMLAASRKR